MAASLPTDRLADPGALLATVHQLDSGLMVRLRLTRPSDRDRVGAFLADLSDESLHARFGPGGPSPADRDALTYYHPLERVVIAAAAAPGLDDTPGEAIVGIVDISLHATGVADLGMLVHDDHQTQGIGRLMSEVAAQTAIQRGATHLRADMPQDNPVIVNLLKRIGPTVKVLERDLVAAYTHLPALRRRSAA